MVEKINEFAWNHPVLYYVICVVFGSAYGVALQVVVAALTKRISSK